MNHPKHWTVYERDEDERLGKVEWVEMSVGVIYVRNLAARIAGEVYKMVVGVKKLHGNSPFTL